MIAERLDKTEGLFKMKYGALVVLHQAIFPPHPKL
jgi:hypothetical protein